MNRFDLEYKIMDIFNTIEDLKILMTEDEIDRVVFSGLVRLLELKCDKLFDCYKQVFKLDEYNKD